MASIQDIHTLEQRIYDVVDDYIREAYLPNDVLAIGQRCGKITLKADSREAIKVGKNTKFYPLKGLVRTDEKYHSMSGCLVHSTW